MIRPARWLACRSRLSAPALAEPPAQIAGRRADGGEDAEARGDGGGKEEREHEHRKTDRDALEARQARGRQGDQSADSGQRPHDAEDAAGEGKQEGFGQELAHQPSAWRPESAADGELAVAHRGLREQQVRHVRARHEQQESHRAEENQQRPARFPRDRVLERLDRPVHEKVVALLARSFVDPACDRADVPVRLRDRHTAAQAPDGAAVVRSTARVFSVEAGRHPQLRVRGKAESGRKHADDGVHLAVDLQVRLREVALRPEVLPPVPLADEDGGRGSLLVVGRAEVPPEQRPDAEDPEEAGRHVRHVRARGLEGARNRHEVVVVPGHRLETAVLIPEVVEVRVRQARGPALRGDLEDGHDPARVGVRQRPKKDAVDDAEDGRRRADTERERDDHDRGDAGLLAQHPRRVPEVLPESAHVPSTGYGSAGERFRRV